ncbi:MAG: beta-ketoacyl-ACP synthase II [Myxococcota bacterium]
MPPQALERERRVVVTGCGAQTPLGLGVGSTWEAALAGRSAVGPITRFDARDRAVRIAAELPAEVVNPGLPAKEWRRLDRFAALALAAAEEAVRSAGTSNGLPAPHRRGVVIGSSIGGVDTLLANHRALLEKRRVSAFTIPMTISNIAAGLAAIRHGLTGPTLCTTSACASGAHAIGEAAWNIRRGAADWMLAGGSDALVNDLVVAAFAAMRALSTRNDDPERASRPFDRERDGFVVGEGAGAVVLESLDSARARGAPIRAELVGYAAGGDAYHLAAPDEHGAGAARCMEAALNDAGVPANALGYVNAHATGTPAGDVSEARALRQVLGDAVEHVPVSATKSMTGHLLGAAGAVEAILCVRALETGWLPPTVNLEHPDPECSLAHVARKAIRADPKVVLSNSFGFGGTNATLIFRRWEE